MLNWRNSYSARWRDIGRVWLLYFALLCAGRLPAAPKRLTTNRRPPRNKPRLSAWRGPTQVRGGSFRDQVTPHWFKNAAASGIATISERARREFVLVDAERESGRPAFDHQKLAASLSKVADLELKPIICPSSKSSSAMTAARSNSDGRIRLEMRRDIL